MNHDSREEKPRRRRRLLEQLRREEQRGGVDTGAGDARKELQELLERLG
ncbi:hypothetical protein [Pyrodictium delaneyi]|nr:hypothetical protein [Pyrodictium delaneyi]